MFIFNIFCILYYFFIPVYKKRKMVMHATWVLVVFNIILVNFDTLRYSKSLDKNGNKYTYDRLTGKKWKNLNR